MQTRHDIATNVNGFIQSVCGLQTVVLRTNSKPAANTGLAKVAVQCSADPPRASMAPQWRKRPPPDFMRRKKQSLDTIHHGGDKAQLMNSKSELFNYGPLGKVATFEGTHPEVMKQCIQQFHWKEMLNYNSVDNNAERKKHKHERLKYRLLTFLENNFLSGKRLFQFKNYELIQK